MQVAIIAPIPLLKHCAASTYHMALTHLVLESPEYAAFYAERSAKGDYVILDNSLIELGEAADMEKVIKAARIINPVEIVLPDVMKDGKATVSVIREALNVYGYDLTKYKLMAVAQGKNYDEWLQCYQQLTDFVAVDTIGIPKHISTFTEVQENPSYENMGRRMVCDLMAATDKVSKGARKKEHHLLGVWNNPIEIMYLSRHEWIRGVDSVIPVWCGSHGVAFDMTEGLLVNRPLGKVDFNHSRDFCMTTAWNIHCMKVWANCR